VFGVRPVRVVHSQIRRIVRLTPVALGTRLWIVLHSPTNPTASIITALGTRGIVRGIHPTIAVIILDAHIAGAVPISPTVTIVPMR
jgi:hypothetical protein